MPAHRVCANKTGPKISGGEQVFEKSKEIEFPETIMGVGKVNKDY